MNALLGLIILTDIMIQLAIVLYGGMIVIVDQEGVSPNLQGANSSFLFINENENFIYTMLLYHFFLREKRR
jgi:hypothetical protein